MGNVTTVMMRGFDVPIRVKGPPRGGFLTEYKFQSSGGAPT
jgi:hypothetical protein